MHSTLDNLDMDAKWTRVKTLEREPGLNVSPVAAKTDDEYVRVTLSDGRIIALPTFWIPRLVHATAEERANVEFWHDGVMWPDVEADISVRGLLLGLPNGENPACFAYWLENRRRGVRVTVMDWLELRKREQSSKEPQPLESTTHA